MRTFPLALIFLAAGAAAADDAPAAAYARLQGLVGGWKLANPASARQAAFRITYRLISNGSALVESFQSEGRQPTETIYHLDGKRLMATHYCAQGNQPRLLLREPITKDALDFEFLDATNLPESNSAHMIRMKFEFRDAKRFRKTEVYLENGKEGVTTLSLERAPGPDAP